MLQAPAGFPLQVAAFLDDLSKDNWINNGDRVLEKLQPRLNGFADDVAEVAGDPSTGTWVLRINGNVVVTVKARPPFIAFEGFSRENPRIARLKSRADSLNADRPYRSPA